MNQPVWKLDSLPERLAADLASAPTETAWRREFAPELSYGRHAGPARCDARPAAVALALCLDDDGWSMPLTLRCASLTRHGGQVSFPGGLVDPGETPYETAERELGEELGQRPRLRWVGRMAPLLVFASNAVVTPCVAAIEGWPDWAGHPPEVDRVLRLELRLMLEQSDPDSMEIQRGPLRFRAPRLAVEDQFAWGATAVLLGELRARLRRIEADCVGGVSEAEFA